MHDIKLLEADFCRAFLDKRCYERVIYELGSKKRNDGIKRFCHNAEIILRSDKILRGGSFSETEIAAFLKEITDCREWLLIGWDSSELLGFDEAVSKGTSSGMGFAAVSADLKAAAVREEQCFGTPTAYILKG